MTLASQILRKARKVSSQVFAKAVDRAIDVVLEEKRRGRAGEGRVVGGSVRLPLSGEVIVVGDLHGDLDALESILKDFDKDVRGQRRIIFLGDYGDRGDYSAEVFYTILALKENFPDEVVMMRGNHEGPSDLPFSPCDLPLQMELKFGAQGFDIYTKLTQLFDQLYHVVIIEDAYLLLHGGVPTEAETLDDLERADELHPKQPHLEEILWNDPGDRIAGSASSPRCYGRIFGRDVTERVLDLSSTKTLIRGHEPCEGVSVRHGGLVLTLFSCKKPYWNRKAAFLNIKLSGEPADSYELAKRAIIF